MIRSLITGGSGFIGKALSRYAINDGELTIVDNLSSSTWAGLPEKALRIESDCSEFFKSTKNRYDYVYHLASPVGPVGVLKYKGKIAHEIITHLYDAAMYCIENDSKLCYVSTSEIYGQNPIFDQPEDIDKIVPSNYTVRLEYGAAKLTGEIMLSNLKKAYPDFKYFIIRPFNIVGNDQNASLGFVIPRFVYQALNNEDITVYGDGTDKRTFTDVKDITRIMNTIMKSDICNTFNVGNPDNVITIGELARLIKSKCDSTSKIVFIDPKELHGKDFEGAWNKIPNIDRLKSLVGDYPKSRLDDILDEVIQTERTKTLL